MPLYLLDRDGVIVVNRPTNIKVAGDLQLIPGSAQAIARLNKAGYHVAICTNQPEVARGVITEAQLLEVHDALKTMLLAQGARIESILCCTKTSKCPSLKPAGGMLLSAMRHFGASAGETSFVGDQADDLKAAFHAGCRRVLVRTGLGARTVASGLPDYVSPVSIFEDLSAAVDFELA
jgi:D-glycero-D-manno-heptose 1,7-bisphosphate phosphatase